MTKRRPQQCYDDEQVTKALTMVALCSGNTSRAAEELEAQGLPIPRRTLANWVAGTHGKRYEGIREEILPLVYERMALESEDLAAQYANIERATIEQMAKTVGDLRPAEAAGAARNLATARGISIDKSNVLRDRPTSIVKHMRDPDELWARIRELGGEIVDGDAEEERARRTFPSLPSWLSGCRQTTTDSPPSTAHRVPRTCLTSHHD